MKNIELERFDVVRGTCIASHFGTSSVRINGMEDCIAYVRAYMPVGSAGYFTVCRIFRNEGAQTVISLLRDSLTEENAIA